LEDIEMKRSHFFTLAAAFSIGACTDNPVAPGPADPQQPILPTPSTTTIAGRIKVVGSGADLVIELRDGLDNVYRLVGSNAAALASVDGGDVIARGTFDANPGFVVQEFQVTAMYGRPAIDGWLEETHDGLALRLSDGSLRVVPGLPENCAEHIGARVWVIGWDEKSSVEFGLIA
jgi:hypothetical protein